MGRSPKGGQIGAFSYAPADFPVEETHYHVIHPYETSTFFDGFPGIGTPVPHSSLPASCMLCGKGAVLMQVFFDGKKFKAARMHRKLSQIALAEQAETTERYLRELENGRMDNPSAAVVYRLSAALKLPMEEFMAEVEETE